MESTVCVSAFVLLLVTIAGFPGCHGCDVAGVAACQASTFQNIMKQPFGSILSEENVQEACSAYANYQTCVSAFLEGCDVTQTLSHGFIIHAYEFLCSPLGREGFTASASCWAKPEIARIFNTTCVSVMTTVLSDDVCDAYKAYITCAKTTTSALCETNAVDFIETLLKTALRPMTENRTCSFNLDLDDITRRVEPTTSVPSPTPETTTLYNLLTSTLPDCNTSRCLALITPAYEDYIRGIASQGFNPLDTLALCPHYNSYVECMRPINAHCTSGDMGMAAAVLQIQIGTACGDMKEDLLAGESCWRDTPFQNATVPCFQRSVSDDVCRGQQRTHTCLAEAALDNCQDRSGPAQLIRYLNATAYGQLSFLNLNCTFTFPTSATGEASTTTTTPPTTTTPASSATTTSAATTMLTAAVFVVNATVSGVSEEETTSRSTTTTSTTSTTTTTTTTPTVAPVPEGSSSEPWSICSTEVNTCFRPLFDAHQTLAQQLSWQGPNLHLLESLCPAFEQYATCVVPHGLGSCGQDSQRIHLYLRLLLGYICSPITRATIKLPSVASCWQRNETRADLVNCSHVAEADPFDHCGTTKKMLSCYAGVVGRHCDSRANRLWRGFLVHLGAATKIILNISTCDLGILTASEANPDTTTLPPTTTTTTPTTTTPPREAGCAGAKSAEMVECLDSSFQEFRSGADFRAPALLSNDSVALACRSFEKYLACVDPVIGDCTHNETLGHRTVVGSLQFLCSDTGRQAYLSQMECWHGRQLKEKTAKACLPLMTREGVDACTRTNDYSLCVVKTIEEVCDREAADTMSAMLVQSTRPLHEWLGCALPPALLPFRASPAPSTSGPGTETSSSAAADSSTTPTGETPGAANEAVATKKPTASAEFVVIGSTAILNTVAPPTSSTPGPGPETSSPGTVDSSTTPTGEIETSSPGTVDSNTTPTGEKPASGTAKETVTTKKPTASPEFVEPGSTAVLNTVASPTSSTPGTGPETSSLGTVDSNTTPTGETPDSSKANEAVTKKPPTASAQFVEPESTAVLDTVAPPTSSTPGTGTKTSSPGTLDSNTTPTGEKPESSAANEAVTKKTPTVSAENVEPGSTAILNTVTLPASSTPGTGTETSSRGAVDSNTTPTGETPDSGTVNEVVTEKPLPATAQDVVSGSIPVLDTVTLPTSGTPTSAIDISDELTSGPSTPSASGEPDSSSASGDGFSPLVFSAETLETVGPTDTVTDGSAGGSQETASAGTPDPGTTSTEVSTSGQGVSSLETTLGAAGLSPSAAYAECWADFAFLNSALACMRNPGYPDKCRELREQTRCLVVAVQTQCDPASFGLMSDFVRSFQQASMKTRGGISCDLPFSIAAPTLPPVEVDSPYLDGSTVIDPQPAKGPFSCFDCHSGHQSYRNRFCPTDGNLVRWGVAVTSCNGPCFTRTDKYHPGEIFRGCYDLDYPWLRIPNPPGSGSQRVDGDVWFFCYADHCNANDMSHVIRKP